MEAWVAPGAVRISPRPQAKQRAITAVQHLARRGILLPPLQGAADSKGGQGRPGGPRGRGTQADDAEVFRSPKGLDANILADEDLLEDLLADYPQPGPQWEQGAGEERSAGMGAGEAGGLGGPGWRGAAGHQPEWRAKLQSKLSPELFNRWECLCDLAGKAEAVEVLQDIIRDIPQGEVLPELFHALFPFELDDFQLEALAGLGQRKNVIVSAPTGSGKTVAGELAIYYALALGLRVFYTTPLKALSNQKFSDFRRQFGANRVGLLTGDTNYNREAQVCVMTTEVFRNMLYDGKGEEELRDVFAVVFDEFHYMNDRDRGTVWEEAVISCPDHVLMVALSATMANVGDIQDWIEDTHGDCALVTSDFRPVPLSYWYGCAKGLYTLFKDPDSGPGALKGVAPEKEDLEGGKGRARGRKRRLPDRLRINPQLLAMHEDEQRRLRDAENEARDRTSSRGYWDPRERQRKGGSSFRNRDGSGEREVQRAQRNAAQREVPSFQFIVRQLRRRDMLPAIVFIFSRAGCDRAAADVGNDGGSLLTVSEAMQVQQRLEAFQEANPQALVPQDRADQLMLGVATHHAGLLPAYKSLIEDLFASNLCKVVFATETLAAGINMPARTTVISVLSKRADAGVAKLEPSQLLQMAGRAGRRGKDTQGSVVLLRSRFEDVVEAHRLLLSPLDKIESKFRSSYSMAVNVLKTRDLEQAKELVEKSFGNFLQRKKLSPVQQVARDAEDRLDTIRDLLEGVELSQAKSYLKLWERLKAEERILSYLVEQEREVEQEVVETVLPISRMGAGILLMDGQAGALVGDYTQGSGEPLSLVLTRSGEVLAVAPEHVRVVDVDEGAGLKQQAAMEVCSMIADASGHWTPVSIAGALEAPPALAPPVRPSGSWDPETLSGFAARIGTFLEAEPAGHVQRQMAVIERVQEQMNQHAVSGLPPESVEAVLRLSQDILPLEDKVRQGWKSEKNLREPAWEEFQAVCSVLHKYDALEDHKPTGFGELVGAINAENELWLALVLLSPAVKSLSAVQLAAFMPSVLNEYSRPDQFTMYGPSPAVEQCIVDLMEMQAQLTEEQIRERVDVPIRMDASLSGLVESWAQGCDWAELCQSTSLDQGDLCRLLRRTMEMLRQIPLLPQIDRNLKGRARKAVELLDRFPVSDDTSYLTGGEEEEEEWEDDPFLTRNLNQADETGSEGPVVTESEGSVASYSGSDDYDVDSSP